MITRFLLAAVLCLGAWSAAGAQDLELGAEVPGFKVRPGYRITLVAQNIGEVRFLEFGEKNTLYVSEPRAGKIITLREKDGIWSKVADFTTDKPTAHGMCFYDGWLWFTQSGVIWKARDTNGDGKADEEIKVVEGLPEGGGHWWRSILVTPDGFYTSIGDTGNITDLTATDREKIWKFSLDGKTKTLFASGIRNTEKLRLRPGTEEVWGCDHGSDNWGGSFGEKKDNQPFTDKIPPCEFNHYIQDGFYGHPFIVGAGLPRLEFKDRPDILELASKTISPAWSLGAHWAPNGWNFLTGDAVGMKGDAVIACHGSWNSTLRVGYRVEHIIFDTVTGLPMGSQMLVSTLGENGEVLGRPCDLVEAPDGSLLLSDDSKGRIFRIAKGQSLLPSPVAASGDTMPPTVSDSTVFRPMDYFQNKCARCHGDYGAAYGPTFGVDLSDERLKEFVKQMAEGPAQSPLTPANVDIETAFHKALRDKQPYAVISFWSKEGLVEGEALPGSKLWIQNGEETIPISLNQHSWQVKLAPKTTLNKATLHVQKDGKEIVLPFQEIE